MTTNVTEQTLLEGSWWALEQAKRLLGSARILFESGDFSTALAVAMFGQEEVGRSRLLRDLVGEVREGTPLDPGKIKKHLKDHERKLKAANFFVTLSPPPKSQEGKALRALNEHEPGSEQWKEANDVLTSAAETKLKQQPKERHKARMNALYVDIHDRGAEWLRPSVTITEDQARLCRDKRQMRM
jgi:AbiV family abortive infection protein